MRTQHVPQPRQHTVLMRRTMAVAMPVLVIFTGAVTVAAGAAARVGHARQHAPARPLQHTDNNQPDAPANTAQHHLAYAYDYGPA